MSLRRFISAGAIFAWPLDNQPLQEARDRHVVTGAPTAGGIGPYGPFLTFDGAADYITLGAAYEDQLRFDSGTQDFSVVAWVRRDAAALATIGYVIDKRDGAGDGWRFRVDQFGNVQFSVNFTGGLGPATIQDTLWHSVIGVVDRSVNITVYLDGIAGTPAAAAGIAMATTTAPTIGAQSYVGGSLWNGDIAGVFAIPQILSAAECLAISNGEAF
jgi:hypothetical protein